MTIVKYSESSEIGMKLKRVYTIENKDLSRQERIAGRELPRKRFIKLFRQHGTDLYFPMGCFADRFVSEKKLTEPLTYTDNGTTGEMVEEQDMIMNNIDFEELSSGLIEMKTGRGKGNLIIKLIEHQQNKTLIAVHNKKTLFELLEKFKKFSNYEPGLYYSGKKQIKDITITTHKSLMMKVDEFKSKFGTLIIDECLEYDTLITTDKGLLKIGDIVTNNISCNALSYNEYTKQNEYKKIIGIKEESNIERELYEIEYEGGKITCTGGHLLFTENRGFVKADEITIEDDLKILTIDTD